jgi:hypothetical protein
VKILPELVRRKGIYALVGAVIIIAASFGLYEGFEREHARYPEIAEIQSGSLKTYDDYKEYFVSLAKRKTAVYAFDVLKYADIPSNVDTHRIGHNIGYVQYEQKGLKGIYDCTTDFRNACEHAIVVQALILSGPQALIDVAKVCSEGPGGITAYVHCFHGVGHGLMAYLGYDFKEAEEEEEEETGDVGEHGGHQRSMVASGSSALSRAASSGTSMPSWWRRRERARAAFKRGERQAWGMR